MRRNVTVLYGHLTRGNVRVLLGGGKVSLSVDERAGVTDGDWFRVSLDPAQFDLSEEGGAVSITPRGKLQLSSMDVHLFVDTGDLVSFYAGQPFVGCPSEAEEFPSHHVTTPLAGLIFEDFVDGPPGCEGAAAMAAIRFRPEPEPQPNTDD